MALNGSGMPAEWATLLDSSKNLNLSHRGPRINRTLKGIEKEAQRLAASKSAKHVPANLLCVGLYPYPDTVD